MLIAVASSSRGGLEFGRALPRALREIRRTSVNWKLHVNEARSRPTYTMSVNPHVCVISLPRTPARRARLVDSLERLEVSYEIFFAVDGKFQLDYKDVLRYAGIRKQRKLRINQVDYLPFSHRTLHERLRFGCYMSHVRLWERQVKHHSGYQVILEDDVSLTEGFYGKLMVQMQNLPDTWDIFYLNSCRAMYGELLRPGLRQLKGALCTFGYAISLKGASKLIQHTAIQSEKPVDHMLDEAIYTALLTAYHADPPLIFPRKLESTLAYPS